MAKVICLIFAVLSLFIIRSHGVSVINNVTVSSDALQDAFFNEILSYENLTRTPQNSADNYNDFKCLMGLRQIITEMPSLKVLPFIDAWGSIPSGILKLHFVSIGNFDQCLRISTKLNALTGVVNGQHCFASIPLLTENTMNNLLANDIFDQETLEAAANFLQLSIGICIPDNCSPKFVTTVFQSAMSNLYDGALSGITVGRCKVEKKPEFSSTDITGIVIFSIFGALMLASTAYDFLMGYFDKSPNQLLLAFSIFTNGKKLFAINTKKSPNSIDCLTGIRVFSMAWVMYCHSYTVSSVIPLINSIDILSWYKKPWSMHVLNATVSVDSFLFISGLLVAWLGLRELDKTKGKLNVIMMYVHRYLRLTPPVMAVMLFLVSVYKFLIFGPYQATFAAMNNGCAENWWLTLLYVQNYVRSDNICVPQTWYLAVDFHLYILSPLVLIPMWKWGRKFSPVVVILGLLSIGCVIGTFFAESFTGLVGISDPERMRLVYFPTHTRYSVWLVGLGLGYFMHINRQRAFRISKVLQLLGWTVAFTTIVAIIFGPYFEISSDRSPTVFESAMYESLKRVSWAIALAWIVFACHFGFGGFVNSFLSHPFWQPLGRLTYSLYLVHLIVLGINFGSIRTETYFSDYNEILTFWSTFGISILGAVILTLSFEAPVLILEKALFSRARPNKDANAAAVSGPDSAIEIPSSKTA